MATFTTTKVTLDEIAGKTANFENRVNNLLTLATALETQLLQMQTDYSPFSTELDADAAANAGDAAWDAAKAEKDKLQAEFVALKNRASAIVTAITGL